MSLTTAIMAFAAALASSGLPMKTLTVSGHPFVVEVAATPAAREHGLMGRQHLPADHGMLFVFDRAAPRSFWMKNTLLPLDMLFFDAAGQLVSMQVNVPPCTGDPCPLYPSDEAAKFVLEVPAGTAWRLDLWPGAKAQFSQ